MAGNPNHGKDGKFSSGEGGGNRAAAKHIANQHKEKLGHKIGRYALTAAVLPGAIALAPAILAARGIQKLSSRNRKH